MPRVAVSVVLASELAFQVWWLSTAQAQDRSAAIALRSAQAELNLSWDGFHTKGARGNRALAAHRAAVRAWIADFLSHHPQATSSEIDHAIKAIEPLLGASLIRLDRDSVLVASQIDETGDVFILVARGGDYVPAWSADQAGQDFRGSMVSLGAWSVAAANEACRDRTPERPWGNCGPLYARVGILPPDVAARRRFFVDATWAQEMGATVSGQLSLWSWDGAMAKPLLVRTYGYMVDQSEGVRLEGDVLKARVKQEYRSFFDCGACDGRQLDWSFHIAPDRVSDLGKRSVTPEMDAVDRLLRTIGLRLPAVGLASPQAVAALKQRIPRRTLSEANQAFLGMVVDHSVTGSGPSRTLCLATDQGGTLQFELKRRQNRWRVD